MDLKKWLSCSLVSLFLVAVLGTILRYKIAYSLSFIDQRNLLHGHSHFAFSGWVSQALMALVVSRLSRYAPSADFRRYNWILWANLVCAYGMLVSFPIQGYGLFSILFSTLELVVSYVFMGYVWRDIARAQKKGIILRWFKAATLFNALSSVGALTLAFMMATKSVHQHLYLGSVYFFLHFQYNGWFLFVILGLLFEALETAGVMKLAPKNIFLVFFLSCFPSYFLSALWMPIPSIVYWAVIVAAIAQAVGWAWTVRVLVINRHSFKNAGNKMAYNIICLSLLAVSIKILLQLGSTIPSLSKLAFGFRPIVIGYLHLVLLGVTTLFIIGYAFFNNALPVTQASRLGVKVFIAGIIANELVLMTQGLAAMNYVSIPYINDILFVIAVFMLAGLVMMNSFRVRVGRYISDSGAGISVKSI